MINITKQQATEYVKQLIDDQLERVYYGDETSLKINDVDDLHDYTIESEDICQIDSVYYALNAMLPIIFNDIIDYIDDAMDYYDDCWGTMALRETIGFCDF